MKIPVIPFEIEANSKSQDIFPNFLAISGFEWFICLDICIASSVFNAAGDVVHSVQDPKYKIEFHSIDSPVLPVSKEFSVSHFSLSQCFQAWYVGSYFKRSMQLLIWRFCIPQWQRTSTEGFRVSWRGVYCLIQKYGSKSISSFAPHCRQTSFSWVGGLFKLATLYSFELSHDKVSFLPNPYHSESQF